VINCYRDLKVWQKAMDLVVECYRLSMLLPKNEVYGLTRQIQRAAVSVPANIAEGHGGDYRRNYLYHLSVASGSLKELETHLLIGARLSYLREGELELAFGLTDEIGRMLTVLSKKLQALTPTP